MAELASTISELRKQLHEKDDEIKTLKKGHTPKKRKHMSGGGGAEEKQDDDEDDDAGGRGGGAGESGKKKRPAPSPQPGSKNAKKQSNKKGRK